MFTFVLKDKGTNNQGWWLKINSIKELTKKQREFLYDYFMDMGDRFKAEQFLEE